MSKRPLRKATRPVRNLKASLHKFFGYDLPLFIRRRLPFLRHLGSRAKPGERSVFFILTTSLLALLLIIAIIQMSFYIGTLTEITNTKARIKDLQTRLNGDMTPYQMEYATTTLQEAFSASQLTLIAQKYYSYEILVNGQPADQSAMTVTGGELTLEIVEAVGETELPAAIIAMGSVTGGDAGTNLGTYITVQGDMGTYTQDFFPSIVKDGDKTIAKYQLTELQTGNVLKITFRENLANHLDFSEMELTIG